jgi:hypothetical protein
MEIAAVKKMRDREDAITEGETASGSLILRRFSPGFFAEIEQVSQSNRLVAP